MPTSLHVQLLGGFRLAEGEVSLLPAASAIQQALLTLLVIKREAPLSRQQVAFSLWPDSSERQAQANLRTLLVRWRRAWPELDQYIDVTPRTFQWKPDAAATLDLAEFEAAIGRAEAQRQAEADAPGIRANLEQAVQLYRGDLLPHYDADWLVPERERLRQIFLKALRNLIELLGDQHDFSTALGYAHTLLRLDPLEETSYQGLMRLHAWRGDRAGVVRLFETCAAVLRQELGVEPSPITQAMYHHLLQQEARATSSDVPAQPAKHNLPYALTSFIGREREIAELTQRLCPPAAGATGLSFMPRLLTLSGTGGSGKTRLALRVAGDVVTHFPEGVWWVDLAPLTEAGMVARAVAAVLEVQEQSTRPLTETLAHALGSRRLLLILDNCEHLVAECARLASQLLAACPNLRILATSQEALGLAGEMVYPIPPLPLTLDSDQAEPAEAVQLFAQRAALVLPTFSLTPDHLDAVVQICRRLDGIPLAIELAAARVQVLSVDQIAARLAEPERFNWLAGTDRAAPARHQTLRAMVDWSHALLAEPEQVLLRRLAVFAGGFTLAAAEAVGAVETDPPAAVLENLSRLIGKSLVVADEARGEGMRYRLLETIRQYAFEKLAAAAEVGLTRERHAQFFLRLATAAAPHLQTTPGQRRWLSRLEADYGNLRAALRECLETGQTEMALDLGGQLGWFWIQRSDLIEGRQWLERAVTLLGADRYPLLYARALVFVGILSILQTEERDSKPWVLQALSIARAQGDQQTTANALNFLAVVALREGGIQQARAYLEESQALFQQLGDWPGYARAAWHLGWVVEREGGTVAALKQYEQALTLLRDWGDPLRQSHVLRSIGWNQYELGDRAGGRTSLRESLTLVQSVGHKAGIAHTLRAIAERIEADPAQAVRLLVVVLNVFHALGAATYEQALLDHDLPQRQAQLDEVAFARARDEGNALTLEQAIQEALLVE